MLRLSIVTLLLCLFAWLPAQNVFINELHYDDSTPGGDINEGVEIAGPAGTNLACYKLLLYNGSNGSLYNTLNLSGTIPNQCNGFGTIWFALAPIQNGAPDGIALVFDPSLAGCSSGGALSVEQFLSYEGSFTASGGDANGMTSVDIGERETNSTSPTSSLQLTGNGTTYTDFSWAPSAGSTHDALNNGQTFGGVCGTTVASELRFRNMPTGCFLAGDIFMIEVCATDGFGNIDSSYTGTVTLSKATGPGTLGGTLSLNFNNGCATFSSLNFDSPGTYGISANDGNFSATSPAIYIMGTCNTCPSLTGAFIDACGSNEGTNEILFFNSGNFCLGINPVDLNVNYGTTNPPATNYTSGFTSNQSYVDSLNQLAGCTPAVFVDAYTAGHIPPGATFLLMRFNPLNVYNFSNLCGQGAIYCVFSTDPDWNSTGNFKNCNNCSTTGATSRFFQCDFSSLHGNSGCNFTHSYVPCTDLTCGGNGDGLNFAYGGGSPSSSWNQCVPSSPLPVVYAAALSGQYAGTGVTLNWRTAQESNSSHFILTRATGKDGLFEEVGRVNALGNSQSPHAYEWVDPTPPQANLRYRLEQVDLDGNRAFSRVVYLSPSNQIAGASLRHDRDRDQLQVTLTGQGEAYLRLYGIDGRTLLSQGLGAVQGRKQVELMTEKLSGGVFLYQVQVGNETFRGKVRW